jgi:glycosyltransferase involved in cell wall biosynthesis
MTASNLNRSPDGATELRVAVVADLAEERWPSMDLVADTLLSKLSTLECGLGLHVELLRPTLRDRGPGIGRYVNRFWDYPRWLKQRSRHFDVFHVVDHSYAHLVHQLPADRTIVTCHDIDAFLPVAAPSLSTTRLPLALTRRVLSGMRKAAHVTCISNATYDEARRYNLLPADRSSVVPVGTRDGFSGSPVREPDAALESLLGPREPGCIELLHVGSCITRKRIDRLLEVFAAIRRTEPHARLLKAGGAFTAAQQQHIESMDLARSVTQLPFLDSGQLASLYRRADVLLLSSDREGFGLPVVEALACGTPVIATDIPVFREVGGDAVTYCAPEFVEDWVAAFLRLREEPSEQADGRRQRGFKRARQFSWDGFATHMARLYRQVGVSTGIDATT